MSVLPLFTSHYSIGEGSLLTLVEAGKSKAGGPVSICDLAKEHGLKEVVLCESRLDGFIEAYKNLGKVGAKMVFGWKAVVCANIADKTDASLATESKVVLFCRDTQGYHDLIRLHNRAWQEGMYYRPRLDWTTLRALWTDHLVLGLPYFSSFLKVNQLSFNRIVPDLPVRPWVFKEQAHGLPFGRLIDMAIDRYAANNSVDIIPCKQVYYAASKHLRAHIVMRAIFERSSFDCPNCDHLSSDAFSWEAFMCLTNR